MLFSSTAIQEPVTLKCELFHPEQKKEKTVIAMQTNYIFFDMYIVHEYQVEENVLTKTYLLANKILSVYSYSFLSVTQGGTSHKA